MRVLALYEMLIQLFELILGSADAKLQYISGKYIQWDSSCCYEKSCEKKLCLFFLPCVVHETVQRLKTHIKSPLDCQTQNRQHIPMFPSSKQPFSSGLNWPAPSMSQYNLVTAWQ